MTTTTPISPPTQLQTSIPATVTAVQAIDAAVAKLEVIPAESSSIVPHLAGDISTAKAHGTYWTSTARPAVAKALAGVSNFSSTFTDLSAQLIAAANALSGGTQAEIDAFKTLLTQLQAASTGAEAPLADAETSLNTFDGYVEADLRAFNADAQTATAAKEAATQTAQSAQARLRGYQQEYAEKEAYLNSLGPLKPLAKAVIALLQALGVKIGATQQQIASAEQSAQQAMSAYGAAMAAVQVVNAYKSTVSTIAADVSSMLNGWQTLEGNFATLLQSEQITTFNVFTAAQIEAVQADWKNLAAQAASL